MEKINNSLTFLMNLTKVQAMIARRFDRLSIHGISFNEFMILYLLRHAAETKMRRVDLAGKVGVTASAVTRMLLPMEKIGLITREVNERDARVSYVVLSTVGSRILNDARKTANQVASEIIPGEMTGDITPFTRLFAFLGGDIQ